MHVGSMYQDSVHTGAESQFNTDKLQLPNRAVCTGVAYHKNIFIHLTGKTREKGNKP